MVAKKKETLVHLDLDTLSKEVSDKKTKSTESGEQSTLGITLKKAREKKKMTIKEVSQKLHIRDTFLEALETGHYYVFPGLAYGVGFLRTYAEFLGLDSKELINEFHAETSGIKATPMEMPIPQNHNLMPSLRTILMSVIALLIAYLVWYIAVTLSHKETTIETTPQILKETTEPLEQTPTEQPIINDTTPANDAPIMADAIAPGATNVVMKETSHGTKNTSAAKIYGAPQSQGLSLLATEEAWVEIRDGERVVLEEVLYPGDRYNVPADATGFVLNTANAGALTVQVNGKTSKPLGGKGTLVEGIILDINNFN